MPFITHLAQRLCKRDADSVRLSKVVHVFRGHAAALHDGQLVHSPARGVMIKCTPEILVLRICTLRIFISLCTCVLRMSMLGTCVLRMCMLCSGELPEIQARRLTVVWCMHLPRRQHILCIVPCGWLRRDSATLMSEHLIEALAT